MYHPQVAEGECRAYLVKCRLGMGRYCLVQYFSCRIQVWGQSRSGNHSGTRRLYMYILTEK